MNHHREGLFVGLSKRIGDPRRTGEIRATHPTGNRPGDPTGGWVHSEPPLQRHRVKTEDQGLPWAIRVGRVQRVGQHFFGGGEQLADGVQIRRPIGLAQAITRGDFDRSDGPEQADRNGSPTAIAELPALRFDETPINAGLLQVCRIGDDHLIHPELQGLSCQFIRERRGNQLGEGQSIGAGIQGSLEGLLHGRRS